MAVARPAEMRLRFLAAPTDTGRGDSLLGGRVGGGQVLEWIDKAGYACATAWSGTYCVTAYVGDVRFTRLIAIGDLVEAHAQLVHTGRTSLHVVVSVSSGHPTQPALSIATRCLVVFVAVDGSGSTIAVPPWVPDTVEQRALQHYAARSAGLRADIERSMAEQRYTDAGTGPRSVLRFLAAPTDVNWGGKVHGGTVMRWIDDAAFVCASGWVQGPCTVVYVGGFRFYRPLLIGDVVEVDARLLHTGRTSLHISVHVRSGDPKSAARNLTTHCLIVFVALDGQGLPTGVQPLDACERRGRGARPACPTPRRPALDREWISRYPSCS